MRKPIIRFDNLFSYDTIEDFSQGWTPSRNGGFVSVPSEITLTVVFTEKPLKLLSCAMAGHMFDKVVLDYGQGRTIEFSYVIIESHDYNDRCTVNMLALRVKVFQSEQEKREFDIIRLINIGELYIGNKK